MSGLLCKPAVACVNGYGLLRSVSCRQVQAWRGKVAGAKRSRPEEDGGWHGFLSVHKTLATATLRPAR